MIVGPHCLNWFSPTTWGNSDYLTLELSRIALVVQIFAVAVELPKKYMAKHWRSVFMLLVPVMTAGWLIVGAFMYLLIPGFNFSDALIVSGCITATDPVLAAAVVGKGKFAQRVPGHLRNILSAESGCNDGMAFPFIFLGLNLVMHRGHAGEIVKDWIAVSILYECVFGCLLGAVIGYLGRHAIKYAEGHNLIDRESFLAFYIVLALMSAGFGSMLGVDDLLVSFAAGATFAWDGWFARKTEETHVSTVIDLLLNTSYFVYFGAIIPWDQFNNHEIGTDVWRLVVLAIVVLFLRRIPAVLAFKPLIPDIKTWREAFFCGHFGPIGVGAVYAAILARSEIESLDTNEKVPLKHLPSKDSEHYQLIASIWPIITFLIISSIVVHGSSVAVLTLGRHLNSMAISMSFTTTNTGATSGTSWINRLPKLESNGRSFSLQRVDTKAVKRKPKKGAASDVEKQQQQEQLQQANTVETSGIKYRPAGGIDKKRRRKRRKNRLSKLQSRQEYLDRNRPAPAQFDLTKLHKQRQGVTDDEAAAEEGQPGAGAGAGTGTGIAQDEEVPQTAVQTEEPSSSTDEKQQSSATSGENTVYDDEGQIQNAHPRPVQVQEGEEYRRQERQEAEPTAMHNADDDVNPQAIKAFGEGDKIIVEDRDGEVIDTLDLSPKKLRQSQQRQKQKLAEVEQQQLAKDRQQDEQKIQERQKEEEEEEDQNGQQLQQPPVSRTSSLSRVASYSSKLSRKLSTSVSLLSQQQQRNRVFAYKVDNYLVIENEDGEVIRRYEIHSHSQDGTKASGRAEIRKVDNLPKKTTARPRSDSLMGKTLSKVGLKKLTNEVTPAVPVSASSGLGGLATAAAASGAGGSAAAPGVAGEAHQLDAAGNEDDYITEEDDDDEDEDIEDDDLESLGSSEEEDELDESEPDEETEVEKKRRLAALSNKPMPRDEEDEEDSPVPMAATKEKKK